MMRTSAAAACIALASLAAAAAADDAAPAEPQGAVSFYNDIRPLLQEHCQGCHQPAQPKGGLVLTGYAGLLKPGESTLAPVVPGNLEESYVLEQIAPKGDDPPAMPKDRPPLSAAQVELFRRWIAAGAIDDSPPAEADPIDMQNPPVYTAAPVITSLQFSPDGTLLAVSGYHEVLLHAADGSQIVARLVGLSERIESLAFSPDGLTLAVTGGSPGTMGEVQFWDVATRSLKLSLNLTYDTIFGASWSPDGTRLAFGCADNSLRAIDAATGQQVLFQGAHNDWVLGTVFSTDASHLISVSRDRSMKLTEVATQRFEDNITSITPGALKGGLMTVDRHPTKDELLIGGADGVPKLYKTYREQVRQIGDDFNKIREYAPLSGRIYCARFNRDGSRIVVASSSDGGGEVRVFNTEDAAQVSQAEGQPGPVYAVAFSPDGRTVAAGGFDGQVRLYEAETGKLVKEFPAAPVAAAVAVAE